MEFRNSHDAGEDAAKVFEDAKKVRTRVFMDEQGFECEFGPEDEHPDMIHIAAYEDGTLAGCARIFPSSLEENARTEDGKWVFGRLAVLPEGRGNGAGSAILAEGERLAKAAGATSMILHAQCVAQPFYQKSGYEAFGPIELDEHVEHRWMRKDL